MTKKRTNKRDVLNGNTRFLLWACEIYIITVAIVVVSAWLKNMHPYELNLTVSKYIGLQRWTSTLYLFMAILMCLILAIYIFKTKFRLIRKYVYFFVLIQIIGCAWFPSMGKLDRVSTLTHKSFAYSLVFGIALSFFLMLIWGTTIRQKLFSIIGLLYSGWFIFFYTVKEESFMNYIFVWENIILFLLIMELAVEDTSIDAIE